MLLIIKNKINFQFNENFSIFIQHQGLLGAVVRNVKETSPTKSNRGRNIVKKSTIPWQLVWWWKPVYNRVWPEAGERRTEIRKGPKSSQACSWVSEENHLKEAHTETLGGNFWLSVCVTTVFAQFWELKTEPPNLLDTGPTQNRKWLCVAVCREAIMKLQRSSYENCTSIGQRHRKV